MANLKDFVWEKTKDGMKFDVYASRVIKVGEYTVIKLTENQLIVDGNAKIPIIGDVKGAADILIQDSKRCTVKLSGGGKQENLVDLPYHVAGNQLFIDVKRKVFGIYIDQMVLQDRDSLWSWIGISIVPNVFVWIGGWPKGLDIADEDFNRDKFKDQPVDKK